MPKIAFVGDVHGQINLAFAELVEWQKRSCTKIDGAVFVGDFGIFGENVHSDWSRIWKERAPLPIESWILPGNHEGPVSIREWQAEPDRVPNAHLIPDGGVVDVLGVKVGGVWGNYSPKSWADPARVPANRTRCSSPRIAMHIDKGAVDSLLAYAGQLDVLVTHDSARCTFPTGFGPRISDPYIREQLGVDADEVCGGCPGFDEILKKHTPKRYYFGHFHVFEQTHLAGGGHETIATCLSSLGFHGSWFDVVSFGEDHAVHFTE